MFVLPLPLALLGLAASTTNLGGLRSTIAIGVPATIDGILYLLSSVAAGSASTGQTAEAIHRH